MISEDGKKYILGVGISNLTMKQSLDEVKERVENQEKTFIVTPNPEIVLSASKNHYYRKHVLNEADLSLADGTGLIFAGHILNQKIVQRIAGADFALRLIKMSSENNWPIYLLGGGRGVAQKAAESLIKDFPDLNIVGAEMGLEPEDFVFNCEKYEADQEKNRKLIQRISKSQAKILILGMSFPRQEMWLKQNLNSMGSVCAAIGAGGTLDYWAGKIKRAPAWLRKFGLEWLYRIIKQPDRANRIFKAVVVFPVYVLKWFFRINFVYRRNSVAVIKNQENRILIVRNRVLTHTEKKDHWQLPQGGVEKGENYQEAVIREMCEELGVDKSKLKVLKELHSRNKYEWKNIVKYKRGYKGQKQKSFVLQFLGNDYDFDFSKEDELSGFEWVDKNELLAKTHPLRRSGYEKILLELG